MIKADGFDSQCQLSKKFIAKFSKLGIVESVQNDIAETGMINGIQNDIVERGNVKGIPKLHDANEAGGENSFTPVWLLLVETITACFRFVASC
ncbi:DNA topoisomerase 2-like [Drosophila kikkawai]|uniref:DNA topoisomerase 2-like n=1 Tax=Drosophila kikkawai TaxID=30033 RepID=A0ABM4GNW2_DROKI